MPVHGERQNTDASSISSGVSCDLIPKESQGETKAGVRVSVNLQHFFTDRRARAFMWAPYGRSVEWLVRRVATVFHLPGEVALMSRGHALPMGEPLRMLNHDDPIDVLQLTADNKQDPQSVENQNGIDVVSSKDPQESTNSNYSSDIEQEDIIQVKTHSQPESSLLNRNAIGTCTEGYGDEGVDGAMNEKNGNAEAKLAQLKRRALQLLDEHASRVAGAEGAGLAGPAKRTRRRRRRRRRPADATDVASSDDNRNQDGTDSRSPRLVRPLSPLMQPVS